MQIAGVWPCRLLGWVKVLGGEQFQSFKGKSALSKI